MARGDIVPIFLVLFLCSRVIYSRGDPNEESKVLVNYVTSLKRLMSEATNPCDNFYEYVCKGEVNGTYSTMDSINSAINLYLQFLLEIDNDLVEVTTDSGKKLKTLYDSCKNLPRSSDGILHHKKVLKDIVDLPPINSNWLAENFHFIEAAANLSSLGISSIISLNSVPHYSNPSHHVILITPERLTKMSPTSEKLNNIIELYLRRTLRAYNLSDSAINGVVQFEREALSIPYVSRKTSEENSIELSYAQLKERLPEIEWDIYFNRVFGNVLNDSDPVILWDEQYLHNIMLLINKTKPDVLGNFLFSAFAKQFMGLLRGSKDTCLKEVKRYMPDVIGAIYVQNLEAESRQLEMLKMFSDLKSSFLDITKKSDWMDEETMAAIRNKISAIEPVMGFFNITSTDQLESEYKDIELDPKDYFKNVKILSERLNRNFFQNIKQQNKKYLRDLFDPTESNAGYLIGENRIIIRSGVAHEFVYHPAYPHAVNVGGVGSFIGHEFGHSIDPHCRKFDPEGYLRNWWSNKSIAAYNERIQCLVEQYDQLLNFTGINGVGKHTLQENFADNIGLRIAFNLYKNWLQSNKYNLNTLLREKLPELEFSDIQLFFIAYAKFHCKRNEGDLSNFIIFSYYSPKEYRVIGTLQNLKEFSDAFNCPVGSRMNPVKKCLVL